MSFMAPLWIGIGLGMRNVPQGAAGTTYYFSATGSDSNDGLTTGTPKQTIAAANALTLTAGDRVAFKGGDTFDDATLTPQSGVLYNSYGTGKATISPPDGTSAPISALNIDQIRLSNLLISGTSTVAGVVLEWNSGSATSVSIANVEVSGAFKHGIDAYGHGTFTTLGSFTVTNSLFHGASTHGISGYFDEGAGVTAASITGTDCYDNTGAGVWFGAVSTGRIGSLDISFCEFYDNGEDGAKCTGLDGGTWEYNSAHGNGIASGGSCGFFPWNSNNVLIQYCESYSNTSTTTQDGDGFDFEGCSDCTIQYCYSHDNKGSGFQMYEYVGSPGSYRNTFRFNVSENDATTTNLGGITIWAGNGIDISDIRVHNNTIYTSKTGANCILINGIASTTGFISNNIFQAGAAANVNAGSGIGGLTIDNNVWFGGSGAGLGTNKITSDPKLVSVGDGTIIGIWNPSSLTGYRLQTGSPALDAGADIASTYGVSIGSVDFYGNAIGSLPTNLGAYDGAGVAAATSFRITQSGDSRVTQAGDTRITN